MEALGVDKELSPLVRRTFSVANGHDSAVLRVDYSATTNRMLRVAVNAFFDYLAFNIEVMEQMDEDVLDLGEPKETA